MKPDGVGVDAKMDEGGEVEPSEFFLQMGMLVLESRLPMPSLKGRQDGPHCPRAVGDWSSHVCDMSKSQCLRAVQVQKQIQILWRNHVPLCIEVLLLPDCEHGQQKALSTDVAPPVTDGGYVLLEQWTLQNVSKKFGETLASPRTLFQAMRSYLHFSQLSAWLNASQGTQPNCIGYRVSPPAEFCTTNFTTTPEIHVFPLAAVNKSINIKVSLALLSRLPDIPKPICYEWNGKQACGLQLPVTTTRVSECSQSTLDLDHQDALRRSTSPRRLDKPNILHSLSPQELEMLQLSTSDRGVPNNKLSHDSYRHVDASDGTGRQSSRNTSLCKSSLSSELVVHQLPKETGAIPKRPSLQLYSIPEVCLSKPHLSPQEVKYNQFSSKMSPQSQIEARFKDLIIHNRPYLTSASNSCTKSVPVYQGASSLLKENTDSDSSSPDFDLLLNTTLANRCEPMTPEEMADYLYKLCPENNHRNRQHFVQTHERNVAKKQIDDNCKLNISSNQDAVLDASMKSFDRSIIDDNDSVADYVYSLKKEKSTDCDSR